MNLDLKKIRPIVKIALREDMGRGDITTNLLVPENMRVKAKIMAKDLGVVAGIGVAEEVFKTVESSIIRKQGRQEGKGRGIEFKKMVEDGDEVDRGETIAEVRGRAQVVLTGERTALNFLQHLSGIATLTRKYVQAMKSARPRGEIKIYDTRKTLPGLRYLEKYAVSCGGGYNHRMGLYDMVLVKDNHWRIAYGRRRERVPSGLSLEEIRGKIPKGMKLEVEVNSLRQLKRVLAMDANIVMLDNIRLPILKKAIRMVQQAWDRKGARSPAIEVSGKINLKSIKQIAHLGVDRISVGEITHSVRALDISLEVMGVTT
ncbi:MAG: carboxylating nicotinate-nucleotide diphosphorylase [bacterium]